MIINDMVFGYISEVLRCDVAAILILHAFISGMIVNDDECDRKCDVENNTELLTAASVMIS